VGLVVVVVGVLAEDDDFDCVEGGVAGPVVDNTLPGLVTRK
jgi:hypothetical protein